VPTARLDDLEQIYAVTSLSWRQAWPNLVAAAIRGHWRFESRHWIRDATLGESWPRFAPARARGHGHPAELRLKRHRLAGAANVAGACRRSARHAIRAHALLT
jgi:hypothetical protein